MNRTFVIGDIHGAFKALKQCLERSNFDYENDTLIQLGDVVDGYSQCVEVVDELLKIKNLISVKGNHDSWFVQWVEGITRQSEDLWDYNGGVSTRDAYKKHRLLKAEDFGELNPKRKEHYDLFFKKQLDYYIDDKNRCFVHAGYNNLKGCQYSFPHDWIWDRDMISDVVKAISKQLPQPEILKAHSEIFIGHTPTICYGDNEKPVQLYNLHMLDTGTGWGSPLTIMNVDTKEYWQSDKTEILYSNEKGRR